MKAIHAGGGHHVEDTLTMMVARFGPALVGAAILIGLILMSGANGRDLAMTAAVFIVVVWLALVVRPSRPGHTRGGN